MSRWYVTDGSTVTELPGSLKPAQDAYFPALELQAFRPPGGTTIYYEGDGLPMAGFLELVDGVIQASGGVALFQAVTSINAALLTATRLVREEGDGTIEWGLSVGKSHVTGTRPVAGLSNVFSLSARLAVTTGGSSGATILYVLTDEDGNSLTDESGNLLLAA
jgi:hypothetical protein